MRLRSKRGDPEPPYLALFVADESSCAGRAERVDLVRHDEGGLRPLSDCAARGYRGLIPSLGAVLYGPGKTRRSVSRAGP
jgi:hypothetical protein